MADKQPQPAAVVSIARFAALLIVTTLLSPICAQQALGPGVDWQWRQGRGSYFGDGQWSINKGGCEYGYIWKDEGPTGVDVVAMSDASAYYVDSCGACVEIKCDPRWIKDNYGSSFDRTTACYDKDASVVARVVDTCPCTYPANWWSNKRWCCNDNGLEHFDISLWAFEKLAELRWGVIALQYRIVPCTYKPPCQAKPLANPSPAIPENPPPGATHQTRDWPDYRKPTSSRMVFESGYDNGFYDSSWNTWVQPLSDSKNSGMQSGQGLCAKISKNGALALKAWNGVFQNTIALEFWTYVGVTGWEGTTAQKPDITINIAGNKGGCSPVRLMDLKPIMFQPKCTYCNDYWWGYRIYLPTFGGANPQTVINDPNSFAGCGGNGVWDLNQIEFRHDGYGGSGDKWVCFDHIVIM